MQIFQTIKSKKVSLILSFVVVGLLSVLANFALTLDYKRSFGSIEFFILAVLGYLYLYKTVKSHKRDLVTVIVYFLLLVSPLLLAAFANYKYAIFGISESDLMYSSVISMLCCANNSAYTQYAQLSLLWMVLSCVGVLGIVTKIYKSKLVSIILTLIATLAVLFSFIFPAMHLGNFVQTGTIVAIPATVTAIFNTNFQEAIEYLEATDKLYLSILSLVLLVIVSFMIARVLVKIALRLKFLVALVILAIATFSFAHTFEKSLVYYPYYYYKTAKTNFAVFKAFQEVRRQHSNLIQDHTFTGIPGLYVMVIGESQTSEHMGCYGYNRDTTPFLSSKLNDRHFVFYKHAFANYCMTIQALSYSLTAKNQYNDLNLFKAPTIIDIAKKYGVKTSVITNQSLYTQFDTPVSVIYSQADKLVGLNDGAGEDMWDKSYYYDLKVVDELKKLDLSSDKPQLVIIHLMGSHNLYQNRYPQEFAHFNEDIADNSRNSEIINTYDNSVRYTDFVLQALYQELLKLPNFNAMLYFSDHGEDVEERKYHDVNLFKFNMVKVPMLFAMSDKYMAQNYNYVERLKMGQDKVITNDLVFDVMLSLMNMTHHDYYEPNFDVADKSYSLDEDNALTMHGTIKIKGHE